MRWTVTVTHLAFVCCASDTEESLSDAGEDRHCTLRQASGPYACTM